MGSRKFGSPGQRQMKNVMSAKSAVISEKCLYPTTFHYDTRKKFPDELSELICDSFVSFMCGLAALAEVVLQGCFYRLPQVKPVNE